MGMREEILQGYKLLQMNKQSIEDDTKEVVPILEEARAVHVVGNGSSYNVSLLPTYFSNKLIPHMAFEFMSREGYNVLPEDVILAISQSGRTWDILETVRIARRKHLTVISITNDTRSPLSRYSDFIIPLNAGIEKAIPATKTVTLTLAILFKLFYPKASLNEIHEHVKKGISQETWAQETARKILNARDTLVLSSGLLYPISLEGALKLKESSYLHAEAIELEEYFHGPRAIVDGDPILVIEPIESIGKQILLKKFSDLMNDGRAILLHTNDSIYEVFRILTVLQFLAYWTGKLKGVPVETPRRLSKFVA